MALFAEPIRVADGLGPMPLSFAQQRLWFLEQLTPGLSLHNIATGARIHSRVSARVLQQCVDELLRRHGALRTVFRSENGQPVQFVVPEVRVPLEIVDLSDLKADEREPELRRFANQQACRPFELERGPMLRVALVRLCDTEYAILMTMHHIVADGWSLNVVSRELGVLYDAYVSGRGSPLPEQGVRYADFAARQRDFFSSKKMREDLSWWSNRLANAEPLRLWTDRHRPPVASFAGGYYKADFGQQLAKDLAMLGRQQRCTLFMTLMAGFVALLSRYTGQDDIVIGTPIAGRNRPELEAVVGLFVNHLVLRTDVSGDPTFRELLCRVRETALDAWAHQDVPFEKIVEELHPSRDLSRNPIFQVTLQLYPPIDNGAQSGKTDPIMGGERGSTPFELAVNFQQIGDSLEVIVEYHTDVFDSTSIARMMEHYRRMLAAGVVGPDQSIMHLELMESAEREQVTRHWNATVHDFPRNLTVDRLFEEQVRRTPNARAIHTKAKSVTYAELDDASNRVADSLGSVLKPGGFAAVLLPRSCEMVSVLLGIWKLGAAWIPLDITTPSERLLKVLATSGAALVITNRNLLQSRNDISGSRLPVLAVESLTQGSTIPLKHLDSPTCPNSPGYLIFTSGTTGEPKGILVSHRNLVNYLHWAGSTYPAGQGNGSPLHSSISFDLSFTSVFVPLLAGGCVHLLPEGSDAEALVDFFRMSVDLSLIKLTPAHLSILSQQTSAPEAAQRTRCFVIGGENLLAEDIAFWQRHAPDTALINEYGPTETVVGCCYHRVETSDQKRGGAIPIGRPIWNMRAYVLDRHRNPQPLGVPGELYIAGEGVALGYVNRPDLDAAAFLPDPFVPEARMYRTGDLARWRTDGVLEYLGRLDRQVKIRGYRLELQEVETVLAQCTTVAQVAVVPRGGSRPTSLDAYVVPRKFANDYNQLKDDLLERARRYLPSYMVPSRVLVLPTMPLATSGKVDREALLKLEHDDTASTRNYVAPHDAVQAAVARIWSAVLERGPVGVNDDFFATLGGHSLLATQIMARVRALFKVELPLRMMFEHPTVASFCAAAMAGNGNREKIEHVASLLRFIEGLSDEQVKELLDQHECAREDRPAIQQPQGKALL